MLATNRIISHKIQRRRNLGFLTPFNQNKVRAYMTDSLYTSIIWLSQGKYAVVDNEDYEFLSQWKWHITNSGYSRTDINRMNLRVHYFMHRKLTKCPADKQVDHINGNKLDNRKANLRICTAAENNRSRKKTWVGTSKYKGVSRQKGKWKASIRLNNKDIHLGFFDCEKQAARAYDAGAAKYHGEFASLNTIGEL